MLNTILRNDTYYFSQLGTFLERADNTARILDVKYYVLLPEIEMVGGGVDNVQWGAILRSVSAHRSYRWVYKENYRPWRIAEYLILNQAMPRSLRSCYDEIEAGARSALPSSTARAMRATRRHRRRHAHFLAEGDINADLSVGPARVPRGLHRRATTGWAARSPRRIISTDEKELNAPCSSRSAHVTRYKLAAPAQLQHPVPASHAAVVRRPAGGELVDRDAAHRRGGALSRLLRQHVASRA